MSVSQFDHFLNHLTAERFVLLLHVFLLLLALQCVK